MKKYTTAILIGGMILAVLISNAVSFINDGMKLERLRGSVLRLHILANSDSEEDQRLKLLVRDALLEQSPEIFGESDSLMEAEIAAAEKLPEIERIAKKTLAENGCICDVKATLSDAYFDERVYGDITMPAGKYRALRVEIGEAEGHNWWCVMYPPLCIPAVSDIICDEEETEENFDEDERDILYHPGKYRIRFAIWDKLSEIF